MERAGLWCAASHTTHTPKDPQEVLHKGPSPLRSEMVKRYGHASGPPTDGMPASGGGGDAASTF